MRWVMQLLLASGSRKRAADDIETTGVFGDTSVETGDSRGVKRPAESDALPPVREDEPERSRGRKRSIEEPSDGMECIYNVEVMDGLWTHGDVCGL